MGGVQMLQQQPTVGVCLCRAVPHNGSQSPHGLRKCSPVLLVGGTPGVPAALGSGSIRMHTATTLRRLPLPCPETEQRPGLCSVGHCLNLTIGACQCALVKKLRQQAPNFHNAKPACLFKHLCNLLTASCSSCTCLLSRPCRSTCGPGRCSRFSQWSQKWRRQSSLGWTATAAKRACRGAQREHQPGRCCQFQNAADPQMFIMSTGTECSKVACTKQAGHTNGSYKTQQQAAVRTRTQ